MPTVPVSVWEQISVIIAFSFLLAGLGWILVKINTSAISKHDEEFSKALANINAHYAGIIKDTNSQWQLYFDARSRTTEIIDGQIITQLKNLTDAIKDMSERHDQHDTMVRNALDSMAEKRKPLAKK